MKGTLQLDPPSDVDVSWLADQARFQRKVRLSSYAWEVCVAVPQDVSWLTETDRLWDLLMALKTALVGRKPWETEFLFDVPVQISATENIDVRLQALLSPDCISVSVWQKHDLLAE